MDDPVPGQLPLGRIPQRIMRSGLLELHEVVGEGPRVRGVVGQRSPGPLGKAVVALESLHPCGRIESELTPGHQLIHEGLGTFGHPPPTLSASVPSISDLGR